jgi:pimeloyl-ACP methyl ester carboxylesterase
VGAAEQYNGPAQARSVADLITSLGIARAVVVGYDIGGRTAQALARSRPDLVSAMVISPPPEDRLATPAVVLWPEHDPLFPREWSDRIDAFFSRARLRFVDGVGHYAPLEYPSVIAEEVHRFLAGETA